MYKKNVAILMVLLMGSLLAFQNCGDVSFSESTDSNVAKQSEPIPSIESEDSIVETPVMEDDPEVPSEPPQDEVCNPLNPEDTCEVMIDPEDPEQKFGLKGQLYYLTPEAHNAEFNNNLNNAQIDDYRTKGFKVPVDILMTSVNVSPRSWESGFILPNDEQVKKQDGEKLFEWFHLDLSGFIALPAGSYQFATVSDDGIRLTINDEIIINNDNTHAPKYDCAANAINFNPDEKKLIRVQYFQGPRTQIALQLFVRPASKMGLPCSADGELEIVEKSALLQN